MKFRGIVLHTVGVRGDTTMVAIREYHVAPAPRGRGWSDVGYHYGVRKDGTVEPGRSLTRAGAHCAGANDTIGVCVYGDGDHEAWTSAQWVSVAKLCADLCDAFAWNPEDAIHGHREAPERLPGAHPTMKTCPGKLVEPEYVRGAVCLLLTARASGVEA